MRFQFLVILCVLLVYGCNLNYPADSSAVLHGKITKADVMRYLTAVRFGFAKTVRTSASDPKSFRIKSGLIMYERFLVLEKLDREQVHLNNYKLIVSDSNFCCSSARFYDIGTSRLAVKYEAFKGRTVRVNQKDRIQFICKISKLVLVDDGDQIYLAGLLNKPETADLEFAWATTNKRLNPYPFTEVHDEELSRMALVHFDSLTEYQRQKEMYPGTGRTTVSVFEFRKAERYVLVQYIGFGVCNTIEQNYTALYHVTPACWTREAEGSLNLFFRDLIDVDGDQYPELLMTDSFETAIYEITYKGFDVMESVTWSLSGLEVPC